MTITKLDTGLNGGISIPTTLPDAVLFDVDGTLADVTHVTSVLGYPFDPTPENLEKFHALALEAPAHRWVVDLAKSTRKRGQGVVVATARSERFRANTVKWLAGEGIYPDALYMRRNHDPRSDAAVKADMYEVIRQEWKIVHAIDDNPSIVELWRGLGIPTTTVPGWPH